MATPAPAAFAGYFNRISCTRLHRCFAVGQNRRRTRAIVAETTDGSRWVLDHAPADTGALYGVDSTGSAARTVGQNARGRAARVLATRGFGKKKCQPDRKPASGGRQYHFAGVLRHAPGRAVGGVYSRMLNYSPWVTSGSDVSAWGMLEALDSGSLAQIGWIEGPGFAPLAGQGHDDRKTLVEVHETGIADGRQRCDLDPHELVCDLPISSGHYEPIGAYTYYTVLWGNRPGEFTFYINGREVAHAPATFTPDSAILAGETHSPADQMPGDAYQHVVFEDAHVYLDGQWQAFQGQQIDSKDGFDPDIYGFQQDASGQRVEIWDMGCWSAAHRGSADLGECAMTTVTNLSDFQALDPFFRIIEEALAGLTDGVHFFDLLAEDVEFDYIITVPNYPRHVVGRSAVAELYRRYGQVLTLSRCFDLAVHHDRETSTVVLEYACEGQVVATGAAYTNRYISVLTIDRGKVTRWRDYLDPLAVFDALGWP